MHLLNTCLHTSNYWSSHLLSDFNLSCTYIVYEKDGASFSECLGCLPQRSTNSSIPILSLTFRSFALFYLVHNTCMVLAIVHMLQCTVHLPKQPVPTPMSPMTMMMTSQNQSSCTTLPGHIPLDKNLICSLCQKQFRNAEIWMCRDVHEIITLPSLVVVCLFCNYFMCS